MDTSLDEIHAHSGGSDSKYSSHCVCKLLYACGVCFRMYIQVNAKSRDTPSIYIFYLFLQVEALFLVDNQLVFCCLWWRDSVYLLRSVSVCSAVRCIACVSGPEDAGVCIKAPTAWPSQLPLLHPRLWSLCLSVNKMYVHLLVTKQ